MDWTAIAAIATAIMAVATFFLAFKTRSMAEETREVGKATLKEAQAVENQVAQVERQVAISAAALRVSAQPWLIWEPSFEASGGHGPIGSYRHGVMYMQGTHMCFQVHEQDNSVTGWFAVRNVGNGLALLDMSRSYIYRQNGEYAYEGIHPKVMTPVVPPGETVDIEFELSPSASPDKEKMTLAQLAGDGLNQLFTIEVAYGDSLGNAGTSAKFRAHRKVDKTEWSVFEVEYKLDDGKVIASSRLG